MAISAEQLKAALKKGGAKRLYYVTGNDEYLIEDCIKGIACARSDFERLSFDAKELDVERLEECFFSAPLLNGRLIVVENFGAKALAEENSAVFGELLRDIPDYLTVVLVSYTEGKVSVSKQIEKLMALSSSEIVIAQKGDSRRMERVVAGMAEAEGASITGKASRLLLSMLGEQLSAVRMEIKKLAALSGYGTIEEEHVTRLTAKTTESSVFIMIGALERGNTAQALFTLRDMLDNRTDPLAITANMNTAFINLYRAKQAAKSGVKESGLFSLFDYRKNDRKVSIAVGKERSYTDDRLYGILEILYQLDIDLKSSPVDRALLLEQAVVEISAAGR